MNETAEKAAAARAAAAAATVNGGFGPAIGVEGVSLLPLPDAYKGGADKNIGRKPTNDKFRYFVTNVITPVDLNNNGFVVALQPLRCEHKGGSIDIKLVLVLSVGQKKAIIAPPTSTSAPAFSRLWRRSALRSFPWWCPPLLPLPSLLRTTCPPRLPFQSPLQ